MLDGTAVSVRNFFVVANDRDNIQAAIHGGFFLLE
jgi:hypothetical protein